MKKIFLIFLCSVVFSCSEENTGIETHDNVSNVSTKRLLDPCPEGTTPSLSYEFNTIRLHRKSQDCERGFGLCSDGFWVIDCEDEFGFLVAQSPLSNGKGKTQAKAFIHSEVNKLELFFPASLVEDPEFKDENIDSFGVESDWQINDILTVKRGDYPLTFTDNDLIRITLDTY